MNYVTFFTDLDNLKPVFTIFEFIIDCRTVTGLDHMGPPPKQCLTSRIITQATYVFHFLQNLLDLLLYYTKSDYKEINCFQFYSPIKGTE